MWFSFAKMGDGVSGEVVWIGDLLAVLTKENPDHYSFRSVTFE
jgi:hypothetical protein